MLIDFSKCTWCKLRWIQFIHSSDCASSENKLVQRSIQVSCIPSTSWEWRHKNPIFNFKDISFRFVSATSDLRRHAKTFKLKVSSLSALFSSDCFTWIIILHFRNFSLLFFLHLLYTDYSTKSSFTHRWSRSIRFLMAAVHFLGTQF